MRTNASPETLELQLYVYIGSECWILSTLYESYGVIYKLSYILVAFFTTIESFLLTTAIKNFMFLTRSQQDFYTAFP